jgi:L-amino acid N-acyltransferase YncA
MIHKIEIREMQQADLAAVKAIYEKGIATKNATFETQAPECEEWDKKYMKECRFVAEENHVVTGWAALTAVSGRCVYAGVCEVSVYVDTAHLGKGIGKQLLRSLIASSEEQGIWTLQAGIFPENAASIRLHLSMGFREIGRRQRIGKMDDVWRDTVLLERRSEVVGMN